MADLGAQLTLTSGDDGGLAVVGEVDAYTAPRLEAALEAVRAHAPVVRVDLSGVEFMDSSGLRVLLAALARSRDDAGDLVLVAPSQPVRRLLGVSGLDDHFTVAD